MTLTKLQQTPWLTCALLMLRSLTVCLVILPDGAAFRKVNGLSSGHCAVSFIETVGTIILLQVWLLHQYLRAGNLSLLQAAHLVSEKRFGTFKCLGDDALLALRWEFVVLAFGAASPNSLACVRHTEVNLTDFKLRQIADL